VSGLFDTIAVVDWSSRNDPSPRGEARDALWIGLAGSRSGEHYFRTRAGAMAWLAALLADERAAGRRMLAGFDFPFGYPAGFAAAVTGMADGLALWSHLDGLVTDGPENANNRFAAAAALNAAVPGPGPFWGNGLPQREFEHLPRKKPAASPVAAERRLVERAPWAKGAKSCWQLSGAGSVGGQVLTGLPALWRLRQELGVAVWPFDTGLAAPEAPLVIAEVYPSLLAEAVRAECGKGDILDKVQVRVTARALATLDAEGGLAPLFEGAPDLAGEARAVVAREEAWILGAGHAEALARAARPAAPRLRNDCFALPPGVDWVPVDEALRRLEAAVAPVAAAETVPVGAAGGRVLAAALRAARGNPPAANAAVDGYGFAHSSLGGGPHRLALVPGRAAAGAPFEGAVPAGAAVRILTGALLPEGVDTVVLEEEVTREGEAIGFGRGLKRGANTRAAGEDVAAGAVILSAGHRLAAQDLALAAAVGLSELPVRRRLRVAVLSTGDEIRSPGAGAAAHQTFDANRPMLLEVLRRWEIDGVDLGRAPDRAEAVAAALDRGAAEADAILTSGGASAGDEDHVSALLKARGALGTWRIAVKPGRPLALGVWGGKPVFGLPGNPVAAFVCTLIFARPALMRLAGAPWERPEGLTVPAAFRKEKRAGRREYLRARLDGEGRAEVFASEGSGRISGLAWARGLVELEDGARTVAPGDPVRYLPFAAFGL
jgi:molybdopterin molybdotransferase